MYQYYCSDDELYIKLQNTLVEFKDCFNESFTHFDKSKSIIKSFIAHLSEIEERLVGLHIFIIVWIINLNVYDKKREFSDKDIDDIIDKEITSKMNFSNELHSKIKITKLLERICDLNYQIKLDQLMQIIEGRSTFCHPAVSCILEVVAKLLDRVKQSLVVLEHKPKMTIQNKILLKNVSVLSKWFTLYYSAMFENADDVFYQQEESEDL